MCKCALLILNVYLTLQSCRLSLPDQALLGQNPSTRKCASPLKVSIFQAICWSWSRKQSWQTYHLNYRNQLLVLISLSSLIQLKVQKSSQTHWRIRMSEDVNSAPSTTAMGTSVKVCSLQLPCITLTLR